VHVVLFNQLLASYSRTEHSPGHAVFALLSC
jgi:hypothetical protein